MNTDELRLKNEKGKWAEKDRPIPRIQADPRLRKLKHAEGATFGAA